MPEPTSTPAPKSGAELLAKIRPQMREEATQICLRPDLLDAWAQADAELRAAKISDASANRLAQGGPSTSTKKLAAKVAEIEAAIEESAIMFRFRAMSKDRWQEIVDSQPPRKGNDIDRFAGYDRDAVLDTAVRECLYDPVFEDCDGIKPGTKSEVCDHEDCGTWQQFTKKCNPSEWEELRGTVNSVNRSVVDAPKSVLASQILSSPGSASRRRATGT